MSLGMKNDKGTFGISK